MHLIKKLFLFSIVLLTFNAVAAKVDTLSVKSTCMNKTIRSMVILPNSYFYSNHNFPVVYLLHGAGDDYKGWLEIAPELVQYADQNNFIIVCADGGGSSWYFDSPVDKTVRYETYISKELVAAVDINYRTVADKKGRAISGLSMGGHGAFYLAFKHQDVWGAAGSMSGGLDIRPFAGKWELDYKLGNINDYKENWEKNTVINLLPLLEKKSLKIIFDCGTEDFFYAVNVKVHEKMTEKKIAHEFHAMPGGHTPTYWRNSIKKHLAFFKEYFSQQNTAINKVND